MADSGYKHDDSPESDKKMLFFVEFSYVNPMADTDDGNEESHETMLFFVEFSYVNNVFMVLDNAFVAL